MPEQQIEALFDSKHSLDLSIVRELDGADLELIREMTVGNVPCRDRGRAMDILVAARDPGATGVLSRVLLGLEEDELLRASAANYLGRVGGPEAEESLLSAQARAHESLLRIKIAAALGRAGGLGSLAALQELANDDEEAVRNVARFGMSVVAYRENRRGFDLPVPDPSQIFRLDPNTAQRFEIGPVEIAELGRAAEWVARRPFSLDLSEEEVFGIGFGDLRQVIALNRRSLEAGLAAQLAELPLLMGLVASYAPEDQSYATQWLWLAWPQGGGRFFMAVHGLDGRQIMFGEGESDGNSAQFGMDAVRQAGRAAIALRGGIDGSTLYFEEGLTATVRQEMVQPRLIGRPGTREG